MIKPFENRYNMSKVVQAYMEEQSAATINAAPGLDTDIGLLKDINNKIGELNEFQSLSRIGHRINKDNVRETMTNSAIDCAFALMAFAEPNPDQVLFNEVKTTRTDLQRLRDNDVKDRCEYLHLRATEFQTDLETYGITTAKLNNFQAEIDAYNEQISKPRQSIVARVQLTNKIKIEFKKQLELLKEMDTKVNALNLLFPEFVNEYKTSRIIVNLRGTVLAITGNIKDQAGNPIFGAVCTLSELGRETKSSAKGNFEFKNVANGKYNLEVKRPGFESINQIVSVVKGETTKVLIVMTTDTSLLRVA